MLLFNCVVRRCFKTMFGGVLGFLFSLLLIGNTSFVMAQSVGSVEKLGIEINSLEAQLASVVGEAEAPLRQRIWTLRQNYRKALWAFAKTVDKADAAGTDYVRAKKFLIKESQDIRAELAQLVQVIQQLQMDKAALSMEEREAADQDRRLVQQSYDQLLKGMLDNAATSKEFDLPIENDIAFVKLLLNQRAESLSGSIELDRRRREGVVAAMKNFDAGSEDLVAAERRLLRIDASLKTAAADLSYTAGLLESLGEDVTEYREMEVLATGNLSTKLFNTKVAGSMWQRWSMGLKDKLLKQGPDYLTRLIVALGVLVIFWFLARMAKAITRRGLANASPALSSLGRDFLIGLSSKVVIVIGLMLAVSQLGIKIGPLLAGLGIMGFIVGFALQNTLSNFASGIMILIYRPFDVGDYVNVASVDGEVKRMNLVSTTIHTPQNHRLIIPNNKIWDNIIRNVTSQKMRRVDLTVGVSYSDDVDKVEALLMQMLEDHALVKKTPEPVVRLNNLGESAVEFSVRAWVKSADYSTVFWELTRQIKLDFDANGIRFPFPQRELHITQYDTPDAAALEND